MNKESKRASYCDPRIWYHHKLSITKRIFLGEIENLNKPGYGCFAKNKHFSKWSGLSVSRCSEILTQLFDENYINIEITQDQKRLLTVNFITINDFNASETRLLPSETRLLPSETRHLYSETRQLYSETRKHVNNTLNNTLNNTDRGAHEFIKFRYPEKLNIWEMQNKKQITDYNKFILDFDDKVIIEKRLFEPDILFARLKIFGRNWIQNNNQNKKSKVYSINELPKNHPSLQRAVP